MKVAINIGITGSGSMGSGIALVAARAGHNVVLLDSNPSALNRASESIQKNLSVLEDKGKISSEESIRVLGRIKFSQELSEFKSCGLILEAIIEDEQAKKELFFKIESIVDNDCILASNTSSLSIASIASGCKNPARFIGIHFFNPAHLMPLVEIIPAFTTNGDVINAARQIVDSWGKTTVLAKDTPGFIVNRIARPFYGEALRIYEEGIADYVSIDWAMKEFGGFRMGPFELMDFIGNDINYKVTETVWEQMFYDARYKPSLTQKRLFQSGFYGRKSGRGYYDYRNAAMNPEPEKNELKGKRIFERILAMLINEAADALYLNIASRDDIDTAMLKGVNYPKGLLKWADETGIGNVLKILDGLRADYSEDRYRPSLLLRKMNAEKSSFY